MLFVPNFDDSINFYTTKLGFIVKQDFKSEEGYRWTTLTAPMPEGHQVQFALQVPTNDNEKQAVGKQYFGLGTTNFNEMHKKLKDNGVKFLSEPQVSAYGVDVQFEDLYGNKFNLREKKKL